MSETYNNASEGKKDESQRGFIVDTNSQDGRLDLVVYDDGILAVTGTYLGIILRGAGVGMGGAGGAGLSGAVAAGLGAAGGTTTARTYETRRLSKVLSSPRPEILRNDPRSYFLPVGAIRQLTLRKHLLAHSLVLYVAGPDLRSKYCYEWKPALNNFKAVSGLLASIFDDRLTRE